MRKSIIIIVALTSLAICGLSSADESGKYLSEVFPNGLTVIVKHNPDSRVFGVNILGKNRAVWEKQEQVGITDFVNRMLIKGSSSKSAVRIQEELDDIGAKITTNDIPYIPYDDRYTWRAFSFIKFETIDEFAKDGIKILYEIVADPVFREAEVEKMKGKVMGIMGMKSGSTYQVCRDLYYGKLFENHPLSKPVLGSRRTIGGFTSDDLALHHKMFYNPSNLVMTVVSNEKPRQVMKWVKKKFKNLPPYPVQLKKFDMPVAGKMMGVIEVKKPMDKEQVYIYLGSIVPGLTSDSAPALSLAVEILSSRLKLNLREKQGLAYSVGAGVRSLGEFGWFTCSMGTGFENFETAQAGILAEIENLKTGALEQAELDKARNSLWGSMLMRNMSCVNQAYNMAYYEYAGVGHDFDDGYRQRMDKITINDVQQAAKNFLNTENYIMAYVGKVAESDSLETE
ncbi:MAG: insulinase family protein [candidate division Zixibacteria bacterium]|nr:insulinase family protein [candidate division Zixibacteria bacterium]